MPKKQDLTGMRFGRLVAIEPVGQAKNRSVLWRCKCDCGGERIVTQGNLHMGSVRSCGCLRKESMQRAQKMTITHGESRTRLYNIWHGAIDRCEREGAYGFKNYGARGIDVYGPWKEDFKAFKKWALENGYADDLQIDRIDTNKGYSPDNCRWVTRTENGNNKRNNVIRTYHGVTDTLANLCRMFGKSYHLVQQRVLKGMSIEEALEKPSKRERKGETNGKQQTIANSI